MQKNTIVIIIICTFIIGGALFYVNSLEKNSVNTSSNNVITESTSNVEMREGIQYITITAKNGYAPRTSSAKANIPTKLIIKTNSTYDCSASFVIKKQAFHKILQPTGEEIIDVGTFNAGEKLQGTCSMGMYNFTVTFE